MMVSHRLTATRLRLVATLMFAFLACTIIPAHASDAAPTEVATDHAAIAQVLENYRRAVSTGDEALFTSTVLDDDIPFFGVGDGQPQQAALRSPQLRAIAGFRKGVFHGGRRYTQRFDDIRIVQDGALAQATLRFVTLRGDGTGGKGWKTLTLLDIGGEWKIVSEFYTVRSVVDAAATTP